MLFLVFHMIQHTMMRISPKMTLPKFILACRIMSKERLGSSSFQGIQFDLPALIQSATDLNSLAVPFQKEEIDAVVKFLPSDKAPGPDDFNTDFIKNCWPIICQDFYRLCNTFYQGSICLQSLNSSHITLVPKHDNAVKISDFRPISLLNTSFKIITKLLSNRLQQAMHKLIHKNTYGFLKGRTIQDCLAWYLEPSLSSIQKRTYHSKIGF